MIGGRRPGFRGIVAGLAAVMVAGLAACGIGENDQIDYLVDAAVTDALRAVDALDWVERLPQGLDTVLGHGRVHLTPAQAQQVADGVDEISPVQGVEVEVRKALFLQAGAGLGGDGGGQRQALARIMGDREGRPAVQVDELQAALAVGERPGLARAHGLHQDVRPAN